VLVYDLFSYNQLALFYPAQRLGLHTLAVSQKGTVRFKSQIA